MPTPEIPLDQRVVERPTEIASETLQQSGISSTPTNVKPVNNDKGQPLISTPIGNSAKIQLPADQASLIKKAKGKVSDAATWLAKFLLRMIAIQKNAGN